MRDVVYLAVTFGFFGLATAFVAACDRIVGPDPTSGVTERGDAAPEAQELEGVAR
jgi:hypothetical protein